MTDLNSTPAPARRAATNVLLAGTVAAALMLTACADTGATSAVAQSGSPSAPKIMFIGDSIAQAEAPALNAALAAAGATFVDDTVAGGGTIVDPGGDASWLSNSTWEKLAVDIPEQKPTTIVYQITMYDRGTPEQQQQGYQRLADEAAAIGAALMIVSTPPVGDAFMDSYRDEAATTSASARTVAEQSDGAVSFSDATELWGTDPSAEQALRSPDRTHTCQQGAAAFASWLMEGLTKFTGVKAVAPEEWATGAWTSDEEFAKWDCSASGS